MKDSEQLYTVREAASELRVATITVHRALAQEKLGSYRFGRGIRISERHLAAYKQGAERPAKKAEAA